MLADRRTNRQTDTVITILRLLYRGRINKKYLHTYIHPFNDPLSGTTQVSRYQKCKTNLDFIGARDSEWRWHQLGHMQIYTSLQTNNHASTPPLSFFTGRMPFLPPNQQRQSTEGESTYIYLTHYILDTTSYILG